MPLCLRKVLKLPFPVASSDLAAPEEPAGVSILEAFCGPPPHPLAESRLELTDLVGWSGDVRRALARDRADARLTVNERRGADLAIAQLIEAERALAAALGAIAAPKAPAPSPVTPFPGAA